MGMDGLRGVAGMMITLVIMDHSLIPYSAPVSLYKVFQLANASKLHREARGNFYGDSGLPRPGRKDLGTDLDQ